MPEPIQAAVGMARARFRSHLRLGVLDCLVIGIGYGAAGRGFHGDGNATGGWQNFSLFLVVVSSAHVLFLHVFGLYRRMWRYAGVREATDILLSSTVAVVVLTMIHSRRLAAP